MCNPEVIGIIGTLLGTVLGWILSEFSKRGKLNIYPQWKDSFQHQDGYGGFKTSKNREEAEYYSYKLSLELYNSAGEPKIMRGISVAYFHDKTKILTSVPQDDRTGRSSGSMMIFDDVGSVTIPVCKGIYGLRKKAFMV